MKLNRYEILVLELMLKNKLDKKGLVNFFDDYEIYGFEYTGSGYFLQIRAANFNFKKETINKPILISENAEFNVGFLLFLDQNEIVLECHSWGESNPPENVRDLDLEISIKDDL